MMIKKLWWRWLIVLAIILIIYFLSNIPNLQLVHEDQMPLWLQRLGNKAPVRIGTTGYFSYALSFYPEFIAHKLGHIVAFGTLGVSIYWATGYSAIWAVIVTMVVAAGDEWHQYFVPGRISRFGDVVLDTLAAILFIVIIKIARRKY